MNSEKRKIAFLFIFCIVLIHFLKDITQDILKISSPLDMFGNVEENLSFLPKTFQNIYLYGFGGLSVIAEAFLLIAIPVSWNKKEHKIFDRWILISIIYLLAFFTIAVLLDPNFNKQML